MIIVTSSLDDISNACLKARLVSLLPMASLPSFVQLMAALGLSDPPADQVSISPRSRSLSSPPLRDSSPRQYSPRYSPYSPSVPCHNRMSSCSSSSSLSDAESSPKDMSFRRSAPFRTRRYRHKVTRSDSSSDVAGDTPISTYVRRKTPSSSPISQNFDSGYETSVSLNHAPFSIPTLPVLLTNSPSSDPEWPSDCDDQPDKDQDYYRFILQRTGTRISAARAARREQIARRYALKN